MFVERGLLSLMDDEGAANVIFSGVKDNSCVCCCRRRRCCRSEIETSVGHTIVGDPVGTIDDVTDDAVIDVGVRGGQSEPVSSFPSAPSPASPLLCLVFVVPLCIEES